MESKNIVKTILIDDDLNGRKTIQEYMSKIEELELSEIFDSTQEAYNFILKNAVELIVFNSETQDSNSIDFLKKIDDNIAVIYLHSNLIQESDAAKVAPVNYVLKTTLSLPKFKKAIEQANKYIKASNPLVVEPIVHDFDKKYFLIRENLTTIRLNYKDVSHISALENYIKVHTVPKTFMVLSTLRQFEISINNHPFLRVHRSFIVNLDYISTISKDFITLTNDVQIPIGEQFKKDFENIFIDGKTIKR